MKTLYQFLEAIQKPTAAEISKKIKSLNIKCGWGGKCGAAAIQINQEVFNNQGRLVVAANKYMWQKFYSLIGHVAVEYNGVYWDADAKPKSWEEIESWGMIDDTEFENSEYYSGNLDDAYEVIRLNLSSEEILKHFE